MCCRIRQRLNIGGGLCTVFLFLLLPGGLEEWTAKVGAFQLPPKSDGTIERSGRPHSNLASSIRTVSVNFLELAVAEKVGLPPHPDVPIATPFQSIPRSLTPASDEIVAFDETPILRSHGVSGPSSPAPDITFQSLEDDYTRIPPDTHGAVGPNHVMTVLNSQVRIQDRTGNIISTVSLAVFWSALGNPAAFDPKLLYDPFQNRWIFTACADSRQATSSLLIGVTQNNNPTGMWFLQRIDVDAANLVWIDYPSIGFNKDWIAVSAILFNVSNDAFVRGDVFIFGKAQLYAGGAATFTRWQGSVGDGAVQVPAVTYDNNIAVLYLLQTYIGNDPSGFGFLRLYAVTGAVNTPTLSPVGFIATSQTWSASAPDQFPADGVPDNLAPQCGISWDGGIAKIQTNDDRMQNVVYRNGSLWATHMMFLPTGSPGQQGTPTRSSVQWWEITPSTNPANVQVLQRGVIDDASNYTHYAFPSIAANQNNDVLIGYSLFTPLTFASAAYSYRDSTDPANSTRAPFVFRAGDAPYVRYGGSRNRWGDYSHTVVDPVNDTDFWTIQEYADTYMEAAGYGIDQWGTQWARVGPTPPTGCPGAYDWSRVSVVAPFCPSECSMASYDVVYDNVRNSVLLYQGNGAPPVIGTPNMTWEWNGCKWTELLPSPNPGKRVNHRMAYDSTRKKTVLFGGVEIGTGTILGDTWEYDSSNNTWSQVSTGGAGDPPPRFHPGLAYDAQNTETVLFGGQFDSGGSIAAYGDTWVWNGTSWTQKSPTTSPTARLNPALVYDPVRQVVVMYGGSPSFGPAYDETWEWNGSNWSQRSPSITPGGGGGTMAFDSTRGVAVLYTRDTPNGDDLWQWDGNNWSQLQASASVVQSGARMVYDAGRREMVMYDGFSNFPPNFYPETFLIQSTSRAFCLSGTATGVGWSWCVEGPGYEVCDLNVAGVTAGSNAAALVAQFVTSIDTAGCIDVDAAIVAASTNCFTVTVPGREGFNLIVGTAAQTPTCSLGPGSNCTINPTIFEVGLAGADCNANFTDDALDIAAGLSIDADANGIPDECECVPGVYADLDQTGLVDVDDLIIMLNGFVDPGSYPEADIYPCNLTDGVIDVDDLIALLETFAGSALCPDPCI